MQIIRKSPVSKQIRSMELDISEHQWTRYLQGDGLIQDIFPNLTADEREFIKSGITNEEWKILFEPTEES
jgi:hypothetical protein